MSSKRRSRRAAAAAPRTSGPAGRPTTAPSGAQSSDSPRRWARIADGRVVALEAVVVGRAALSGQSCSSSGPAAAAGAQGAVVQANGGHWTTMRPAT